MVFAFNFRSNKINNLAAINIVFNKILYIIC
jgi:hypothetical protein